MQILDIEINNILSIENASLSFDSNGLILIDGWSYDENRANGAGKTAIANALCWGLFDELPRKITKTEVLRKGAKTGFVCVRVKTMNGVYKVIRKRPNAVEFFHEDLPVSISQQEFEKYIGLTYTQFVATMYAAQGSADRFLFLNDAKKKEFILNLMNMNFFAACQKEANLQIKELEQVISNKKIELQGHLSKIQVYAESLGSIAETEQQITRIESELVQLQGQLTQFSNISKPDFSKYDDLEQKIRSKRQQFNQVRSDIAVLRSQYNQKSLLDRDFVSCPPDANCPACSVPLSISGKSVVLAADETAKKAAHDKNRLSVQHEMSVIAKQINELEDKLLREKELDALESKIKADKQANSVEYDRAIASMNDCNRIINNKNTELNYARHSLNVALENKNKIADLKVKAKASKDAIESADQDVELLKAASYIFSPIGAPAYIMDNMIDSFNDVVGEYINMIWPNASYSLQSFKENKDGSQSAKFSETLTVNGRSVSIGSLSGGEMRALSLALDFAILRVMRDTLSVQLNPIILDEPFDGLDSIGRELVIELLEQLSVNHCIIVIDHASEAKALFNKVIKVEKRGGISSVSI